MTKKILSVFLALVLALSVVTVCGSVVSAGAAETEDDAVGSGGTEITVPKEMKIGDVWKFSAEGTYENISNVEATIVTNGVITAVQKNNNRDFTVTAINAGSATINVYVDSNHIDGDGKYDFKHDIIHYKVTVKAPTPKPLAPTNVRLANVKDGINVTWKKAANAVKYRVYYKRAVTTEWSWKTTEADSMKLDNLYEGELYYFQVQSINADGERCGISSPISLTYIPTTTITSIVYNSNGTVTLAWSLAKGANKYDIATKRLGDQGYGYYSTTATTFTVPTADCGTILYFQVRPFYTTGKSTAYGAWSNTKTITTLFKPTITNMNIKASLLNINYNKIKGATRYKIAYKKATDPGWSYGETGSNYFNVLNPTPNVAYYVQVCPMNGSIVGPYSSVKSITLVNLTKPVVTAKYTGTQIDVSWKAVTGAKGYQIAKKSYSATSFSYIDVTNTSFSDSNYVSGSSYYYQVRAFNGTNYGPWSSVASVSTLDAPTIFSIEDLDKTIRLKWYGVAGATKFKVAYKTAAESGWHYNYYTGTIGDILNTTGATRYYFQICAIGEGGVQGPWSKVYTTITAAG